MSVRRTSGFWHLKKRCCWPWVLYLVLAKEIRWMGIAPEMPWNLGEKNLRQARTWWSTTTELAFLQDSLLCPLWWPQLLPLISTVFSVLTLECHSVILRLNGWSKATCLVTEQSLQPLPLVPSIRVFCHITKLDFGWLSTFTPYRCWSLAGRLREALSQKMYVLELSGSV